MPIDHIKLPVSDLDATRAFYAAARAAGGQDHGPPGERPSGEYYNAAFVLDPDS